MKLGFPSEVGLIQLDDGRSNSFGHKMILS